MCGIAGIFSSDVREITPEFLSRMTKALRHRGPDDEGYVFISTSTGCCEPRIGDDTTADLGRVTKHVTAPLEFPADLMETQAAGVAQGQQSSQMTQGAGISSPASMKKDGNK